MIFKIVQDDSSHGEPVLLTRLAIDGRQLCWQVLCNDEWRTIVFVTPKGEVCTNGPFGPGEVPLELDDKGYVLVK